MVDITVRPARAVRHVDDGDIVLTRGGADIGTVLLADIQGRNWTRQRLQRLANAAQGKMDDIQLISSLPPEDPDRFEHEADPENAARLLLAKYGGRRFYRGTDVVSRSDLISFTLVDGDLLPRVSVVR